MQHVSLGRTGIPVSPIALGTWAFASMVYGDVSESQAISTVRHALEIGINMFDTAPLYGTDKKIGTAEGVLGRALGSDRDKAVISTKFGRYSTDASPNFHAARARESVEGSLRRLGTDRLDVLFFHSPFSPAEIHDDVWEELGRLRDEGKVRAIGHSISMFANTEQMARDWASQRRIDVVQVVYSLMNREAAGLIGALAEQGAGVVARESLANGFLTGAIKRDTVFPENSLNNRYSREQIAERVEYVEQLAEALVVPPVTSMAQAALRWVLQDPGVSTVLTGAKNIAELDDCAAAAALPAFSSAHMARAAELHTRDYPAA